MSMQKPIDDFRNVRLFTVFSNATDSPRLTFVVIIIKGTATLRRSTILRVIIEEKENVLIFIE